MLTSTCHMLASGERQLRQGHAAHGAPEVDQLAVARAAAVILRQLQLAFGGRGPYLPMKTMTCNMGRCVQLH